MNWVTTNIRIPEEDYMELKLKAAKQRTSVAAIIREKIAGKKKITRKQSVDKLIKEMNEFAKKMARQNPGLDLTKALIDMRYEQ